MNTSGALEGSWTFGSSPIRDHDVHKHPFPQCVHVGQKHLEEEAVHGPHTDGWHKVFASSALVPTPTPVAFFSLLRIPIISHLHSDLASTFFSQSSKS
jgi:hypothetical protein